MKTDEVSRSYPLHANVPGYLTNKHLVHISAQAATCFFAHTDSKNFFKMIETGFFCGTQTCQCKHEMKMGKTKKMCFINCQLNNTLIKGCDDLKTIIIESQIGNNTNFIQQAMSIGIEVIEATVENIVQFITNEINIEVSEMAQIILDFAARKSEAVQENLITNIAQMNQFKYQLNLIVSIAALQNSSPQQLQKAICLLKQQCDNNELIGAIKSSLLLVDMQLEVIYLLGTKKSQPNIILSGIEAIASSKNLSTTQTIIFIATTKYFEGKALMIHQYAASVNVPIAYVIDCISNLQVFNGQSSLVGELSTLCNYQPKQIDINLTLLQAEQQHQNEQINKIILQDQDDKVALMSSMQNIMQQLSETTQYNISLIQMQIDGIVTKISTFEKDISKLQSESLSLTCKKCGSLCQKMGEEVNRCNEIKCPLCEIVFYQVELLIDHMKSHTYQSLE